ncbi:MAG: hypothetical protein M3R18_07865 [Pseudomonadota bacterium]|nr:hypothetical protein [Pseudomonadota bacterium]
MAMRGKRVGAGEEEAMTSTKVVQRPESEAKCEADLDRRYGEIGISALAAALRYQSATTKPGYARAGQPAERQDAETAG